MTHLTKRQQEVIKLFAQGMTAKEIARELHVESKTVDNHRGNILEKLAAKSLTEAAIIAYRLGEFSIGTCAIPGCCAPVVAKNLCDKHRLQFRRSSPKNLCMCGCGQLVLKRFATGHNMRLLTSSEQSRRSLASRGVT